MIRSTIIGVLTSTLTLTFPIFLTAQPNPAASNPALSKYRDTGRYDYVVTRGYLGDFTGKRDSIVADAPSDQEAQKIANELNRAEEHWADWTYIAHKRIGSTNDAGNPESVIEPIRSQTAGPLKTAKTNCSELPTAKAKLDKRKGELDKERDSLIAENKAIRTEQKSIDQARRSIAGGTNAGPPYVIYEWTTQTVDTGLLYSMGQKFDKLADAQEYVRRNLSRNLEPPLQRWRPGEVRDQSGNNVTRASGEPGTQPGEADLKRRENDLKSRKSERGDRVDQYKAATKDYDKELRAYEEAKSKCVGSLGDLRKTGSAYKSPTKK